MAEQYPGSPYAYVPGQVTGERHDYLFRVRPVQPDEGYEEGFMKEAWDLRNRYYWQGWAPSKAQGVEEAKRQIDVYVEEEGPQKKPGFMDRVIYGDPWWHERAANPRTPAEAAESMVKRYGSEAKAADNAAASRADADMDWQDSGPRGARNDEILERWDYWDQVIEHIYGRPTDAVRPDQRFAASGFSSRKLKAKLLR
jgi:hypothetical protein